METFIRANYFKAKLAQVKKEVGAQCTYLAFAEERGKHFFVANLLNAAGAKDRVNILIDGTPEGLENKDYEELATILKTRSYATS